MPASMLGFLVVDNTCLLADKLESSGVAALANQLESSGVAALANQLESSGMAARFGKLSTHTQKNTTKHLRSHQIYLKMQTL